MEMYACDGIKLKRALKVLTFVTVVIGGVAFVGYINAFGGISRLLSYADYLRSFAVSGSSVVSYYASILVIPAKLITVTPIVLAPLISMTKGRNKLLLKILFVITFFLAILFNLASAGKTAIILFILCFAVPFLQKVLKHPWRLILILSIFSFPILGFLDSLFAYMQKGIWNPVSSNPLRYLAAFSFPYANILSMGEIVKIYGLRWGKDFVTGPLNIIPGINFQASYEVTSEFFSGENWRVVGGTPNDIITFGYLQVGVVGVCIVAIFLGIVCGKVDRILKDFSKVNFLGVLSVSMIVSIYAYTINSDISGLIRGQFQLYLVAFAILYSCQKVKIGGEYEKNVG